MVIEAAQIWTTHNLVPLLHVCGIKFPDEQLLKASVGRTTAMGFWKQLMSI